MIASFSFSASAFTMMARTVCPRSEGTSLPRAMMRILPSLISFMPNGGAAQPISIWPVITGVSVPGGPPVAVGFALAPSSCAERHDDIVRARAAGRIGDGVLRGRVLERLDRRIRLHIPVEIAGAGEGRQQDAHRRALREGAHHAGDADAGAEIGAAGNDRLDGLARALRAERLDLQIVLLEDAGVLAERRRLVLPVVDLADRDFQRVLRRRRAAPSASATQRAADARNASSFPPLCCFLLRPSTLALLCRRLRRDRQSRRGLRGAHRGADFARPSRSASRRTQYSQARASGPAARLSSPAISASPAVSGDDMAEHLRGQLISAFLAE